MTTFKISETASLYTERSFHRQKKNQSNETKQTKSQCSFSKVRLKLPQAPVDLVKLSRFGLLQERRSDLGEGGRSGVVVGDWHIPKTPSYHSEGPMCKSQLPVASAANSVSPHWEFRNAPESNCKPSTPMKASDPEPRLTDPMRG